MKQPFLLNEIVPVNETNPIAVGSVEGAVAGGGDTGVALMGDVDTWIETGVGVEEGGAGIGRTIVDAEGFPVSIGLRADGVEALGEVGRHVVDGDDDGEGGGHSSYWVGGVA